MDDRQSELSEKMLERHRNMYRAMLGLNELPVPLMERYFAIKRLFDKIDGPLTVGDLIRIALDVGLNPVTRRFEETMVITATDIAEVAAKSTVEAIQEVKAEEEPGEVVEESQTAGITLPEYDPNAVTAETTTSTTGVAAVTEPEEETEASIEAQAKADAEAQAKSAAKAAEVQADAAAKAEAKAKAEEEAQAASEAEYPPLNVGQTVEVFCVVDGTLKTGKVNGIQGEGEDALYSIETEDEILDEVERENIKEA